MNAFPNPRSAPRPGAGWTGAKRTSAPRPLGGARRPLLSDRQWRRLAPIVLGEPAEAGAGVRRNGDARATDTELRTRRALEGVLWVLRRGATWSELPDRFPSAATCRRHWRAWMRDGRWLDLWRTYVAGLAGPQWLDWSRALMRAGERLDRRPARGPHAGAHYAWWMASARVLLWEAPWVARSGPSR